MLKRPDPATMEPPFTPDLVYELLREVLKERRLGRKDPAITHLARALNIMRYEVRSTIAAWNEEPQRLKKIDEAIAILTETLPAQLQYYELLASRAGPDAEARAAAYKKALTALRAARDLGLPAAINVLFFPGPPIDAGWNSIAEDVQKVFHFYLSKQSKEAGYRFVEAVMPRILIGEESPSFDAIKTAFKKNKLSRGASAGAGATARTNAPIASAPPISPKHRQY